MKILSKEKIRLNVKAGDKLEAVRLAGRLLVEGGHAPPEYVDSMVRREEASSTYLGAGLAMPHGTNEAKSLIKSTGLSILVLPDGVDFGGDEPVRLVIGLAALGDEHMDVLAGVAELMSDEEDRQRILNASSEEDLLRIFERAVGR